MYDVAEWLLYMYDVAEWLLVIVGVLIGCMFILAVALFFAYRFEFFGKGQ